MKPSNAVATLSCFKIVSGNKIALMFLQVFLLEDISMVMCHMVLGNIDTVVCGMEKNGIGWLLERCILKSLCLWSYHHHDDRLRART